MSNEIVQVEDGAVKLALGQFSLSLRQRGSLLKDIAAGMLLSVRRTFRDQGSPAGSWAPLAPATLLNKKSKASAGRKILILSGRLQSSIQAAPTSTGIVIGTNLVYARVQQEGSADRRGAATGPQARISGRSVRVAAHSRSYLREIHYGTREVAGRDGKQHHIPVGVRTGMRELTDKHGRATKVRSAIQGPRQLQQVELGEHQRFQNIPPRPFLVIRPDDGPRIRAQVIAFTVRAAAQAGLQAKGGA